MKRFDCIIIGGGPAGLTAALYLARFRRSVALIDSGESRAHLIGRSHNCPGFVQGISGADYLASLRKQAMGYPIELREEVAARLEPSARCEQGFIVHTDTAALPTSQILLATGIRDRHPPVADHDCLVRETLLRYCPICDGFEASNGSVCIVGPAEHAIAKAMFLRTFVPSVTVAVTDDPLPHGDLHELSGRSVHVRRALAAPLTKADYGLVVAFGDGTRERFDFVYAAMGADPATGLLADLAVETDGQGLVTVDAKNRTTVAGVYAAGDAVSDLHQIAVAVGHAAVAATAMHNALPADLA